MNDLLVQTCFALHGVWNFDLDTLELRFSTVSHYASSNNLPSTVIIAKVTLVQDIRCRILLQEKFLRNVFCLIMYLQAVRFDVNYWMLRMCMNAIRSNISFYSTIKPFDIIACYSHSKFIKKRKDKTGDNECYLALPR
jgi:hypothetical protein